MTKSNFDKLAKAPLFARPPRADENASPVAGYGAVRAATDGRHERRAVRYNSRPSSRLSSSAGSRKSGSERQEHGRAVGRYESRLHREVRRVAMLSLWKRKPAEILEVSRPAGDARRNRQLNIKVSDDCSALFAALAKAQSLSKAALFEDMVAGRSSAQRHGVKVAYCGLAGRVMSRFRDGMYPLALRASQAAAMLGISENQLRQWVMEGKVHKPYRVRKNVVLFDAVRLQRLGSDEGRGRKLRCEG